MMAGGVCSASWCTGIIIASLALFQVSAVRSNPVCAWDEYYDENMENCGPCREICVNMKVTRTERQCQKQCSEYLVSLSCRYDEYYDEIVHSCAPCHELCNQRDRRRTTEDCSNKCRVYLTALSCAADEYFNEKGKACASCSDLCSHHDGTDTPEECFEKCPKYLEKNPPGRIVDDGQNQPGDPGKSREGPSKDSSSSASTHPGIIVTIVIGPLAFVGAVGAALYWWFKSRPKIYHPAPPEDTDGGGEAVEDVRGDEQHNNDVRLEMIEFGPSIQVSSEDVMQQSVSDGALYDRQGDVSSSNGQQSGENYGIPECDPLAPSSAAHRYVTQQ